MSEVITISFEKDSKIEVFDSVDDASEFLAIDVEHLNTRDALVAMHAVAVKHGYKYHANVNNYIEGKFECILEI